MSASLGRTGAVVLGTCLAAAVGAALSPWFLSLRGVPGPWALQGGLVGLSACLAALILVGAIGVVVARASNAIVGMFAMGAGLAGMAMRFGATTDIAFSPPEGASIAVLRRSGLETLFWAFLVAIATHLLFRFGGPIRDLVPLEQGMRRRSWRAMVPAIVLQAAAAIVAPPLFLLAARSDAKGQLIAAAACGGVVAGLLGRLAAPHVQPRALFALVVAVYGCAQLAAALGGGGPLADAFVLGTMPRFLRAAPIDLVAGAVIGVALGIGWAKSFLPTLEAEGAATATAAAAR